MSAGQVAVGSSVSLTVTVKEQAPVLPLASVAEQITGVVPVAKTVPEAGLQVTALTPAQLSVALAVKLTTAEHWPRSVLTAMLAGQVRTGASVSLTVTVKEQALVLPLASVAVQVTDVVPLGKVEPLASVQAMLAPGQLSLALAA
jgi:hypothetical protein